MNESEQSVGVMSRSQMMSRWSESLQVKSSKPHYSFHSGPLGQISFTTQVRVRGRVCACVSQSHLCQCRAGFCVLVRARICVYLCT